MKSVYTLIFAKAPQAGLVKTRMTPPLTENQAALLHQRCLQSVCERVSTLETKLILVFTPDDQREVFQNLISDHIDDYWPQGAGDLGDRLNRAVDRAFSLCADAVILLGADSPTLEIEILHQTIEQLSQHEVVLGPCEDGGYYLLAMSHPQPDLFRDIDWCSDCVADQTLERAAVAKIDVFELQTWYDLDRYGDLALAQRDLSTQSTNHLPATKKLQEYIDELILYVEKQT